MKVSIIKYNAGNTLSVSNALERAGINPVITDDPEIIKSSDRVIFPGVGEASTTMQYLREQKLDVLIPTLKQPFLGICLGMQLMCNYSEEGNTPCLNIFPNRVLHFKNVGMVVKNGFKIPHMGWNSISDLKGKLFIGIPNGAYTYFVHSYYVEPGDYTTGISDYIVPFSCSVQKDNFYAVQYHPEKSAYVGQQILQNFLDLES